LESYTLHELNEYIRRVIALNFTDAIWIQAEISQIKSSKGQLYLDLIEKDEVSDKVIAQSQAIIWYKSYLFLKKKMGNLLDSILVDGVEVKLKVKVEFHERYGMKLNIEDVDPSFTLGQQELQKQAIIERLQKEELLEKNNELMLPLVLQRIAIISSATAAGLKDFEQQLLNNPYNYHFTTTLFTSSMQGANVQRELILALEEIQSRSDDFDSVVIIRGGGSKMDLSWFNNYDIGKAIANASLPVITGIGHEIDVCVADLVAHTSLKTPTAAANFMIDRMLQFDSELMEMYQNLKVKLQLQFEKERSKLNHSQIQLQHTYKEFIASSHAQLEVIQLQLKRDVYQLIGFKRQLLDAHYSKVKLLEPGNILKKGYTITRKSGKVISQTDQLKSGEEITTEFKDGNIKSIIK